MRLFGSTRKLFDLLCWSLEKARSISQQETIKMEGLRHPVEVLTDAYGVPYIYADNAYDLFFAQGFVTARDRIFQMDYNRHAASGRLCELLGVRRIPWRDLTVHLKEKTTFDVDVFVRTMGMARVARESWPLHSSEAKDILHAYASGVNAFLSSCKLHSLEHKIARKRPAPWNPEDSLTLLRGIGFELNFSWRAILFGALLEQANIPKNIARVLLPHLNENAPCITEVGKESIRELAQDVAATRLAAEAISANGAGKPGAGSNCFAVAASHSKTGEALLANDTHLEMLVPVPWHEVHLVGGEFDLHGFSLAGVPGIGIGQTQDMAWGITAGLVQDLDIFVEQLDAKNAKTCLTQNGSEPLAERDEVFYLGPKKECKKTIYASSHGPLVSTLATNPGSGLGFSVSWVGHRPGRDFDGLLGLWKAKDKTGFQQAMGHHVCPTYNITYAGKDGSIGYLLAGAIPKRKPGTPTRPLEGWTGEWDWEGIVASEQNPRLDNPACGFLINANNRVAPKDFPHELGVLFEPSNRFERIQELLTKLDTQISQEDLKAIQQDTYSKWGMACRDMLFDLMGGADKLGNAGSSSSETVQTAVQCLEDWDGYANKTSPGAALIFVAVRFYARDVLTKIAGKDIALGFEELGSFTCQSILDLPIVSDELKSMHVDLAVCAKEAFAKAIDYCRQEMGSSPAKWQWGTLHPLICKHRFDSIPLLGRLFSIGPEPAGGATDTINRGELGPDSFRLRVGPALRFVANATQCDETWTVVPGGQSGCRFSRQYDNQLNLFLQGILKPAPASKPHVKVKKRETLKSAQKDNRRPTAKVSLKG